MTGVDLNSFMNEMLPTIKMKTPKQKIKEMEKEYNLLKFSQRDIADFQFINGKIVGYEEGLEDGKNENQVIFSDVAKIIERNRIKTLIKKIFQEYRMKKFYDKRLLEVQIKILSEIEGEEK